MARADERGVITPCQSCGQQNRIPFGTSAKCGKCGTTLADPAEPVDVPSAAAFDALLRGIRLPVVVDFWAPWCGPCHAMAPEVAKVAASRAGQWLIAKVDTEALPDLGQRFDIRSIPMMAVFSGPIEVARTAGARPATDIEAFVSQALARTGTQT